MEHKGTQLLVKDVKRLVVGNKPGEPMEGQERESDLRKSRWFDYFIDKNEDFDICILIRKLQFLIKIQTWRYETPPDASYHIKIIIRGTTTRNSKEQRTKSSWKCQWDKSENR